MLVSAVSMNSKVASTLPQKSKQLGQSSVSNLSNDTFQKSGVSFKGFLRIFESHEASLNRMRREALEIARKDGMDSALLQKLAKEKEYYIINLRIGTYRFIKKAKELGIKVEVDGELPLSVNNNLITKVIEKDPNYKGTYVGDLPDADDGKYIELEDNWVYRPDWVGTSK